MDKNQKVILFPNVKETLFNRGRNLIQEGKFKEACDVFLQLESFGEHKEEVYMGLVVCLMELGKYQDAKYYCQLMLDEQIGDFLELSQMYVSILIQLHHYEEAIQLVEKIRKKYPSLFDSQDSFFYHIDLFLKRAREEPSAINEHYEGLFHQNFETRMYHFKQLLHYDEMKMTSLLVNYLKSKNGDASLKTIMLQVLSEKNYQKGIVIHKFNEEMIVYNIEEIDQSYVQFEREVMKYVEETIGQQDPILFQMIEELLRQFLMIQFPFSLHSPIYYSTALVKLTKEAMYGEINIEVPDCLDQALFHEVYRHLKEIVELPLST